MGKRIALTQGHPDPTGAHLGHALADAYIRGAEGAGNTVKRIEVARLAFPLLRTQVDFERGAPPPDIKAAQETMAWAEHWVIIYPLWLGDVPAVLKGFFEQAARPGFAYRYRDSGFPEKLIRLLAAGSALPQYRRRSPL
jgi:putative NADPH-quinone reductase